MTPRRPDAARLLAALEATWPAAARRRLGPFTLRDGAGGGQRVSAATVEGPFTDAELDAAIAAMRNRAEPPVFQIRPGAGALDEALAARGWRRHDPVSIHLVPAARLAALDLRRLTAFAHWPALALQRALWAEGGIGPARLAVMERAPPPKATLFGRTTDRGAGTAFVAAADGIAGLHALTVLPLLRRHGTARNLMAMAGRWAAANGADWLALAVTQDNAAANGLYASLGMEIVEQYHYRRPPEDGA